nr:ABC transporter permease [Acholeplasmatales bacterium]
LGIDRFKIALHYSASTITSVLIGGIIGLILGPIIIPLMMNLKYNTLYSLINVNSVLYYPSYILIFLVLIIVGLATALIRVYRYLRLSPKDAMDRRNASKKHIFNFGFLPRRAYNLKMALRNIFWSPFKSILVIVGVLGCSALLVASLGVEDTINYGVDLELNNKLSYDIDISYDHTYDIDDILEPYSESIASIDKYQYSVVMAFNDDKLLDTTITVVDTASKSINIELSDSGCTITKKMAESLSLSVGDSISIYLKNTVYNIPIANTIDLFMSQTIYIPEALYEQYDDVMYNRAFVMCHDDVAVSALNKKINKTKGVVFSRTKAQRRATANNYLSLLKIVTNMIRIFAIILAIAVIYDLASLNYNERIRDIAQIKVLGYGYSKNMKTLLYEIGILSGIGCILGMFIGKPLMMNMLELNENDMITFIPHIYWYTYLITFVLTIGVSIILNLILSIRINKLDMVKSIKGAE